MKRYSRKHILRTGLFFFFSLNAVFSFGQLHPVTKESSVHFSIKNFGFKTSGTLAPPEGDINFNPDDLGKSSFHVTIQSESINTDNNSRDEHLRSADYFDVKNHPQIKFVCDKITAGSKKGEYEAVGMLTIKNKTKEIHIPFSAEKNGNGYLFSGSFTMNRRDFDVGGGSTLSNELTVDLKVVAR